MRKIPLSYGLITYLEEIEHTEAALLADDDAKVLAPGFTTAIADWDSIFKAERNARREVIRADAVVAVRNEQLDAATMAFAQTARGLAPALLDKVFTMAPGRFVRTALRKQAERTINVIAVEIGKLDPQSPVAAFGPKLEGLAKGAIAALDGRAQAKGAGATAGNDVEEWKEGINSLRLLTWTELIKIADAKGYPRSWADAFFRRTEDDARKTAEDPTTPAPPGGATPGTP
jgi:hypothetical protein